VAAAEGAAVLAQRHVTDPVQAILDASRRTTMRSPSPPPYKTWAKRHTRLRFHHNGIDRRLIDVHGHVIPELLA
jgi:hypothetical protein